jgi:hypothetical protein
MVQRLACSNLSGRIGCCSMSQSVLPERLASRWSVELLERAGCHASCIHGHHTTSVIRRRAFSPGSSPRSGGPSMLGTSPVLPSSVQSFVEADYGVLCEVMVGAPNFVICLLRRSVLEAHPLPALQESRQPARCSAPPSGPRSPSPHRLPTSIDRGRKRIVLQ